MLWARSTLIRNQRFPLQHWWPSPANWASCTPAFFAVVQQQVGTKRIQPGQSAATPLSLAYTSITNCSSGRVKATFPYSPQRISLQHKAYIKRPTEPNRPPPKPASKLYASVHHQPRQPPRFSTQNPSHPSSASAFTVYQSRKNATTHLLSP